MTEILQSSLPQKVTSRVLKRIAQGDYPPGSSLPTENEMATEYGVSRIVVREATRLLSAKRVIEVQQGRGTFVTPHEFWNHMDSQVLVALLEAGQLGELAHDIVEMREILEVEAAGLAAIRAEPSDIERLLELLESMSRVSDSDTAAYVRLEHQFHIQIWRAAKNRLLLQTLESLSEVFQMVKEIVYHNNWADVDRDHRALLVALEQQDVVAAKTAITQDISRFEDEIQEALQNGLDKR